MSTAENTPPAEAIVGTTAKPARTSLAAKIVHEEPTRGGSYTRNLSTGALELNPPAAVDQKNQE
jgi:hypothetical protein